MAAIDIDEPAQYPVVLSDALMGLSTNEVYTAIRYNHKPENDPNSSSSLRLQPSSDSDSQSYDLSLKANSDRYSYHGVRKSGDGQYVLIFDHEKKHFVLHRIDSTFDMNLISTPWETDPTTLQRNYAQLEGTKKPPSRAPAKRDPTLPKETKKRPPAAKPEPKKPKAKPKPKPKPVVVREPSPEEEEDEDSDDGFIVEYPDGHGPTSQIGHQPSTTFQQEASEESDEDQDAEGEDDDMYPQLERNQDVEHFDLSAPFNDNSGGIDEDDFGDLEAELEKELQKMKDTGDESSESEEE